jgi:hypothetical protein
VNISIPFLTVPTTGSMSSVVCARPPKRPLRRTECARYATEITVPMSGIDFSSRRATFRPAHHPTRRDVVM